MQGCSISGYRDRDASTVIILHRMVEHDMMNSYDPVSHCIIVKNSAL